MMLLALGYAENMEIERSEGISTVNPRDMTTGVKYRIIFQLYSLCYLSADTGKALNVTENCC
jgi:hypothetical protein